MAGIPSFWVNSAACVDSNSNTITHRMAHGELKETHDWLPDGPVVIGITSGASTPDRAVEVRHVLPLALWSLEAPLVPAPQVEQSKRALWFL